MASENVWKQDDKSYVLDLEKITLHTATFQDACLAANNKMQYILGISENKPEVPYSKRPLSFVAYELEIGKPANLGEITDNRLSSGDIEFILEHHSVFEKCPGLPNEWRPIYQALVNDLVGL